MKANNANYTAFDLGSSKISAISAHISKQGEARVLAQVLKSSDGFQSGFITNMELAQNTLISAIYALEQSCGKNLNEVALAVSGSGIKSFYLTQNMRLNINQPITKQDIKKLLHKAKMSFKVNNYEVIHYIPIEFIADGKKVENALGLHASELQCNLHLIAIDSSIITNLNKCFNKCQIEIAEVVAAIYATSSATLTKDEMKIGAILIDMGASSTSYGIFIDDKLLYLNHIPYGGLDITLNIARKFSLSIKDAERIKILYGNASPSLLLQNSAIKIDGSDKIITTVDLANILCDTITNLFQQIKAQCNELSMEIFNVNQVVLTGGSSTLAGLANLATDILEKQTRIAKPKAITGFAESANPHAESTILGMVNQQIMLSKNNIFKYDPQDNKSWWEKTLTWIKENI